MIAFIGLTLKNLLCILTGTVRNFYENIVVFFRCNFLKAYIILNFCEVIREIENSQYLLKIIYKILRNFYLPFILKLTAV